MHYIDGRQLPINVNFDICAKFVKTELRRMQIGIIMFLII